MRKLRESNSFKRFMVFIALTILFQLGFPTVSWALTSGPAQEEFASFEPATTTDMVDLYSGDFTYNIPLLSVPGPNGGYPINLSYHSGVGMEQEASWVGLGWNVNVGAVNRQLNGLPDDFNGDDIEYNYEYRDNVTVGLDGPGNAFFKSEQFGFDVNTPDPFQWQIYYNTFKGMGYRVMLNAALELKDKFDVGLGLTIDSQNGIGVSPSISMKNQNNDIGTMTNKLSATCNNRQGLVDIGFSTTLRSGKNIGIAVVGTQTSSTLSFATVHSVPQASLPFNTTTVPFNLSIAHPGSPSWWGEYASYFPLGWSGYVTTTTLANGGALTSKGYGYLNTQLAPENSVKDFTRNSLEYSKKVPNLASSNYTYDLFNYTGQGAGGMFRPYRSTVDVLTDQYRENTSSTYQVNLEFGTTGAYTHIGFGFPSEHSSTESGRWDDGNGLAIASTGATDYEYAYFQAYGEKSGFKSNNAQENQLYNWDGDQAVRLDIKKTGGWTNRSFAVSNDYKQTSATGNINIAGSEYSKNANNREKRAKVINKLTDRQASKYGLSKNIKYEKWDVSLNDYISVYKTFNGNDHISEIEVIEPDGMRYSYGLPAYNMTQVDETMATAASSTDGTTPVSSGTNSGTVNEYRSKTTLPPYVHSWMLTAVFSADYVDRTGDGPSVDDLGYYTKFNYRKRYDNYQWRLPYTEGSFIQGTNSDEDNMVAYTYGTKEIYFLHSIETKTHIAEFDLTARQDAFDAHSQYPISSQTGTQSLHKLNKIELFSKQEKINNPTSPTPIKTIHFTYDYELCQGVLNNKAGIIGSLDPNELADQGGKLTLKELSFTYENSSRGALSPYKFIYGNSNQPYDRMYMDRWGNFKDVSTGLTGKYKRLDYPSELFPYNDQDVAPDDIASWDLTSIELPTGGTMNIQYEEDDYAYVEGERPMKMYDIVGARNSISILSNRFSSSQNSEEIDGEKIYFALETPVTTNDPSTYALNYFNNGALKKIWYKAYLDIKNGNLDYVSGYAEVNYSENIGLERSNGANSGPYDVGYFHVKSVDIAKMTPGSIHPFRKAAFQYLQLQRPELLYGQANPGGNGLGMILNFIPAIVTNLTDLGQMVVGYNNYCKINGFGKTIYFGGESIVKLYDEDHVKKGGGSRVKQLSIDDNWNNDETGGLENSIYGQTYDYTLDNGWSSGVAYEPRIGGEESALRKSVDYVESTPLSTSKSLFVEQPILENYYPGASVGYSKVTVKSIAPTLANNDNNQNNLLVSSAPISVYEFYTPKDFPIWTDETDMSNDPDILRPLIVPGIYTDFKKKRARSQGYSIVLNDMAGKPKSIEQRTKSTTNNPSGSLISKEEYVYQTATPYDAGKANYLNNVVKTLNSNGTYSNAIIGQTHDIFIDMNENKMTAKSRNIEFNIDFALPFLLAIVPIPYWGDVELSTKTVVTNKIIYRTGILKEIITTTDESVIKQANLAYDINTGSPLLTQVTNEYKDPIFTHNIPSHWYKQGMAGAYQNIGYIDNSVGSTDQLGWLTLSAASAAMFYVGDEVGLGSSNERAFVVDKNGPQIRLMRYCGYIIGQSIQSLTILRSGHRNMLTANNGSVVAKAWKGDLYPEGTPPTSLEDLYKDGSNNIQVIDANSMEYKDQWQFNPNCIREGCTEENPYTNGLAGNWRFYKSYKYTTSRNYNGVNTNQSDGVYADFQQFNWWTPSNSSSKWILANEVTRYSPHGFETESRDALGNYSSARYGYDNSLNMAVAYNAREMEIGVNDFEYYSTLDCINHFVYGEKANEYGLKMNDAHTGNQSFFVENNSYAGHVAEVIPANDPMLVAGFEPTETENLKLIKGKKYIVSAWVKQIGTTATDQYTNFTAPYIDIIFSDGVTPTTNYTLLPEGNIIEGWQRIEAEIWLDNGATAITGLEIRLGMAAVTGVDHVLFDDLRIYPADANMKTFVYNNVSLKLAAELDQNNYATFYIYDEQGMLAKVKKETEKGIMTISENRSSNHKQ